MAHPSAGLIDLDLPDCNLSVSPNIRPWLKVNLISLTREISNNHRIISTLQNYFYSGPAWEDAATLGYDLQYNNSASFGLSTGHEGVVGW